MLDTFEELLAVFGFTVLVIGYSLNIKLSHLYDLQMISTSSNSSLESQSSDISGKTDEGGALLHANGLGINFEDLIQVHAATCNYKELSSNDSFSNLSYFCRCRKINYGSKLQAVAR